MKPVGIIEKPWGHEYLCFRNENVAIWVLNINKGHSTSLHCHPNKNTALIVLSGEIELSFIRDTAPHRLFGLNKLNIFRGRFHQTRALTDNVVLLEVEAPDNKRDILRLEDSYGRQKEPIEEATKPLDDGCLQIHNGYTSAIVVYEFAGCFLGIVDPPSSVGASDCVFVTLTGGLSHGLVPPGDAIDGDTLHRFMKEFPPLPNTTFLKIRRL